MSEKRSENNEVTINDLFPGAGENVNENQSNNERPARRPVGVMKTIGAVVLTSSLVLAAGAAVGGGKFVEGINSALELKATTEGSIADMGQAEIVSVEMDVEPVTLATARTVVTGLWAGFENKVQNDIINLSFGKSEIERAAIVRTEITIDPGKVDINYDPETEQLTYSALDTALQTKVEIPTGMATTTEESNGIVQLGADVLAGISNTVKGLTDNKAEVPFLKDIAAGELSADEALKKFADFTITTQVDKYCTDKIPTAVDGFYEKISENVELVVRGQLLDSETMRQLSSEIHDKSYAELIEIVDNAVVVLPENFEIAPDPEAIASLEAYQESKLFSFVENEDSAMECGVSSDGELKPLEEEAEKEKEAFEELVEGEETDE